MKDVRAMCIGKNKFSIFFSLLAVTSLTSVSEGGCIFINHVDEENVFSGLNIETLLLFEGVSAICTTQC